MIWRNQWARCAAIIGMAVALSATVHAQSIRVVTEEFPPYNFSVDGKITGFSTEVVQAVLKEAQIDGAFQSLPWARAYETAQGAENILIYSIARNPTREKLFKWVGVIAPTQYYLFSRPQRKLKLERLEDARNYQIATVNEDAGEQFLMAHGFAKGQNLQSSVKYELNYEKLKRGRVDLWIMPELVAVFLARQAGDDPSKSLARSFAINELGNDGYYMAFSIQTPDALVARVSRALATVKTNGTYDALKKKWL